MKIASLFGQGKTVFSFEVFPPRKNVPQESIYETLEELKALTPDFISVTYGAGGNIADLSTCHIASVIKDKCDIEPLAHLTCVNSSREEVEIILEQLKAHGVKNILALRGDINPDIPPKKDFRYASELISFIKSRGDFHLSGACYPEGHVETPDMDKDIDNLKRKIDAGAEHLISQLFFDNSLFFDFLEKVRKAGINTPIEAGIMPVINKKQIERMVSLCGASIPSKFSKMMQKYENNPEALRDAGIAYAVDQIVDLISQNVDGIHLYTMNKPLIAQRITASISSLILAD